MPLADRRGRRLNGSRRTKFILPRQPDEPDYDSDYDTDDEELAPSATQPPVATSIKPTPAAKVTLTTVTTKAKPAATTAAKEYDKDKPTQTVGVYMLEGGLLLTYPLQVVLTVAAAPTQSGYNALMYASQTPSALPPPPPHHHNGGLSESTEHLLIAAGSVGTSSLPPKGPQLV